MKEDHLKRRSSIVLSMLALLMLLIPVSLFAAQPTPDFRVDVNAPAVPGQFVIKFKPGTRADQRAAEVQAKGGRLFDRIAALDTDLAEFSALVGKRNPRATEALINAFKNNPHIEYIEPNYLYSADFTPNDPSLSQQWAWNRIQAFQAWDVTQGSSSVTIAVIDTGIQNTHADLDAKGGGGYDFVSGDSTPQDGNGHGTHVAGSAAAETNNSTGGAGTCPNCRLMGVRVLDNNGSGTLANVASGITYAADNGAKVINLSLGGSGSTTLQNAVNYAWNAGLFLACAAGNSNTSSTTNAYPGAYTNCFAVASTTSTDARSSFSNYGTWVEVAAPGDGIYSTWNNGGYNTISGTSMASPHVAGLAGLLASQGLTNAQIRDRICSTSDPISGTGTRWTCGRINAFRAVSGGTTPTPSPTPVTPSPTPPPGGGSIVNGGFESGSSPWVQSSTGGYTLITTDRPHAGSYSAWLGGYNSGTDSIYQSVAIPASGTLRYWWYMTTQESGSTAYDYLRVRLYNSSGTLVATLRTFSNASGAGTWRQDSISLASYAGQTLRVHFSVTTDSSLPSSFFIDDVTLP
jgi:thermitase